MKIFGIGLSKTGTTSLAAALQMLGYKTRDYIGVTRYAAQDLSSIPSAEINANDAFTDTPIPSFYRELDVAYPGSKFILTVRDAAGWLKSCKKQFTPRHAEIQNEATRQLTMDMYGCVSFDEEKFLAGYVRYVEGVKEYFKDRPGDLLILDLCNGEGWLELCAFLGKPVPDVPFPVSNVTEVQWVKVDNIVALTRRAAGKLPYAFIERLAFPESSQSPAGVENVGLVARIMQGYVSGAAGKVNAIITEGLKKLTPNTPVLVDGGKDVSYSERTKWSHFWLVSSFGEASAGRARGPLTINIALIEGRRPKLGVVYMPGRGIAYYGGADGGSFKSGRDGVAAALEAGKGGRVSLLVDRGISKPADLSSVLPGQTDYRESTQSVAVALCAIAEGAADAYLYAGKLNEACIAAAHAVLRGVGKQLHDCKAGSELEYNKVDLVHESFRAE